MFFPPFLSLLALARPALCSTPPPLWQTLPPTPPLPAPISPLLTPINGVHLWSQQYNPTAPGPPIIMIHGGLGYSAYFGDVISLLSRSHHVVAVDRRGHGRSTYNSDDVFTFEMFARDTVDLLHTLEIGTEGEEGAVWVGWSDGAITTLAALLDEEMKGEISKAFIFAGSEDVASTNATFSETPIFAEFVERCRDEYAELQPRANFTDFGMKVAMLEGTLPTWTDGDLRGIEGEKVWIVGAEFDEAVNLDVAPHLHSVIAGSTLKILEGVSHFAPVQDPGQFARAIEEFVGTE